MAETTLSIPFGSGVDTKSDPKMLSAPKLDLAQDCIFTKSKRLTKRNGYDAFTANLVGGGTISNPQMVKAYQDELVLAATTSSGQRLLSYSESLNAWSDRGKYLSVAVTKKEIASQLADSTLPFGGTVNSSLAVSGNLQLYSYTFKTTLAVVPSVNIAVIDSNTGMHLESSSGSKIPLGNSMNHSVVLGASTLAVTCLDGSGNLLVSVITVSQAGGVVIGSANTIGNHISTYSIANTATGAVLSYYDDSLNRLSVLTIDTTGTITHLVTVSSSTLPVQTQVSVGSNGNVWVYWSDRTGGVSSEVLKYAVFSPTLSVVLSETSIASSLNLVNQITSLKTSNTQQTVYYSQKNVADSVTPFINQVTVTSAGVVGTPSLLLNNVEIYSNIASFNSTNYIAVVFTSDLTPTGFLIDLADLLPVAKFLPDQADGIVGSGTTDVERSPGFIVDLISESSTKLIMVSGAVSDLSTLANTTATGSVETSSAATLSTVLMGFDFAHEDAYQAIVQQDTLLLNGGQVDQYDGAAISELGFSIDPEIEVSTFSSGGSLGVGNWNYFSTYEWMDNLGNLHQSAPSIAGKIVIASGTASLALISVKNLVLSQKSGVQIVLWRTISDGTTAFRLKSVANDPTQQFSSFTDTASDSAIEVGPTLYTKAGAVLENISPPPAMVLWTNETRAWLVDSENPETVIEYSKTSSAGIGVSFSTGQLELVIDSKGGAIRGASPMDEKTVILKASAIGYFIGDGANDAGTGSTITSFQFIPSDTGCSNSKSVTTYTGGILFRASNDKGIYLLSRGVQVQYFGMDVDSYNTQDILAADIIANRNQIRFLTSSGSSLLYDYVMNQWSVFTNHEGISSTVYGGVYVYVRTDGSVFQENSTSFLDNGVAISPLIQLSWIKAGSIQGFQRCRRIALLGDFQVANGGHGVQVSVAYDFEPAFSAPVPYYFSGSDGAFQYRERLNRQKCDSFQLQIQEITTGASGEFIDLSDLGLEIMMKTGLRKLPGTQSVG